MKQVRKTFQHTLIGMNFITFKRISYSPLKITLYVVLVSIIIQQLLFIYNSETENKPIRFISSIQNEIAKLFLIALIEFTLVFLIYYLSREIFGHIN